MSTLAPTSSYTRKCVLLGAVLTGAALATGFAFGGFLLLVFLGALALVRAAAPTPGALTAPGVVVDHHSLESQMGLPGWVEVVEFSASSGTHRVLGLALLTQPGPLGGVRTVSYQPDQPSRARVLTPRLDPRAWVALSVSGVLMLIVAPSLPAQILLLLSAGLLVAHARALTPPSSTSSVSSGATWVNGSPVPMFPEHAPSPTASAEFVPPTLAERLEPYRPSLDDVILFGIVFGLSLGTASISAPTLFELLRSAL